MAATGGRERFLEFRGTLLDYREFTLLAVHEYRGQRRRADTRAAARRIEGELLDVKGRRLVSAPAVVSRTFEDIASASTERVFVRVTLRFPDDAVTAALAVDGTIVWRAAVAARPPSLSATAAAAKDTVRVSWSVRPRIPVDVIAVDPDSTARRAVALRVRDSSIRMPVAKLPGGRLAFSVRAAANLREAVVTTETITLPVRPPVIEIHMTHASTPPGQPVTATGTLVDGWGRAIADAGFEWTLDGAAVGHGLTATVTPEVGTHQLTARLPNLDVSRTITVQVDEPSQDARRWRQAVERARRGSSAE
jgi:hypothetical protein